MQVQSLGQEDPLKKEMAIHSSILAWKILWTKELGRLHSTGSHRVGHNCSSLAFPLLNVTYDSTHLRIHSCNFSVIFSLLVLSIFYLFLSNLFLFLLKLWMIFYAITFEIVWVVWEFNCIIKCFEVQIICVYRYIFKIKSI